jgi:hypothetical protein
MILHIQKLSQASLLTFLQVTSGKLLHFSTQRAGLAL